MLTIEKLNAYGADTKNGLLRCAGNEALYLKLVGICIKDLSENHLKDALERNDLNEAFQIAHKLKGGVTNLSLDPVAHPVCELTELLRNKTPGDYMKLYERIESETSRLIKLL